MAAKITIEMHALDRGKGTFYMGNMQIPGQIDTDDLVLFFYPNGENRGTIVIEPRRDKPARLDDDVASPGDDTKK